MGQRAVLVAPSSTRALGDCSARPLAQVNLHQTGGYPQAGVLLCVLLGGKQHVTNAFDPSLASLTVRSCTHPWWEPGNGVCPSLAFLAGGLSGGRAGRGCLVRAPACKISQSCWCGDTL